MGSLGGLHVCALGLWGGWRARVLLLLGLRVHVILLELRLVGVLVDGRLLALVGIWAGARGELVHGYFVLC